MSSSHVSGRTSAKDSQQQARITFIYELPYVVELELCKILNENNWAWEELAGRLGFSSDIDRLRYYPNPTREILSRWSARNPTVNTLFCTLHEMGHQRAMRVLKPYTSKKYHNLLHATTTEVVDSKKLDLATESTLAATPSPYNSVQNSSRSQSKHQNLHTSSSSHHYPYPFPAGNAGFSQHNPHPAAENPDHKKFVPSSSDINQLRSPTLNRPKTFHLNPKYENEPNGKIPMPATAQGGCGGSLQDGGECAGACVCGRAMAARGSNDASDESITDNNAWNLPEHKPRSNKCNKKVSIPNLRDVEMKEKNLAKEANLVVETPKKEINNKASAVNGTASILESLDPSVIQLHYSDILKATDNFHKDRVLGQGGFGVVYKAEWKGTVVAVKRLFPRDNKDEKVKQRVSLQQTLNEMKILQKLRIDNILPLYGVCLDGKEPCLMYMFMVNGSLEDRLLLKHKTAPLTWHQRQRIAEGTCRGLNYLHTFDKKPFVHGDIKSANILLDAYMEPKIGDFGLAREGPTDEYTHLKVSSIHGTEVYLPPEYLRHRQLSSKVDVYSYGVVLLEICTGLRAVDNKRPTSKLLVDYVADHKQADRVESLRDQKAGEEGRAWFDHLVAIGIECVNRIKKNRPEMQTILEKFETIKKNIIKRPEVDIVRKLSLETPPFVDTQQLSPIQLQLLYDFHNLRLAKEQSSAQATDTTLNALRDVRAPPDSLVGFEWPEVAIAHNQMFLPTGVRGPPSEPHFHLPAINGQHEAAGIPTSVSSIAANAGSRSELNSSSISQDLKEPPQQQEQGAPTDSNNSIASSDVLIPNITILGGTTHSSTPEILDEEHDLKLDFSLGGSNFSFSSSQSSKGEAISSASRGVNIPLGSRSTSSGGANQDTK